MCYNVQRDIIIIYFERRRKMNTKFLAMRNIYENLGISQRDIATGLMISLGKVNSIVRELKDEGYIVFDNKSYKLTDKGIKEVKSHKVDMALILACGMGLRLAPLTYDTPKCFIKLKGERMIERQIEQLKSAGINNIVIMVGYMKEKFDYLIDKYNVKLVYNPDYKYKNTLSTLYHARNYIKGKNVYVCVADVYMTRNIYHKYEIDSYYIGEFYEDCKNEWRCDLNNKNEIREFIVGGKNDYCMVGPAFLTKEYLDALLPLIDEYYKKTSTDNYYWEDVVRAELKNLPKLSLYKVEAGTIYEVDNLDDLKAFNNDTGEYGSEAISFVARTFGIKDTEIKDINCIKEGMTNHSYRFFYDDIEYVARIPGEDSSFFINRKAEGEILKKLADKNITEEVIYFNKDSGYKIAKYFSDARTVNVENKEELKKSMALYKILHNFGLKVKASADINDMIKIYIDLIREKNLYVPYEDFEEVLDNAKKLRKLLKNENRPKVLCHGDANPDNVLIVNGKYKLIDFEYGGMADPLTDIALFAAYVQFDLEKTLSLYKYYKEANVKVEVKGLLPESDEKARYILMAYTALSGLYNAVWSIVRSELSGIDYGNYGMKGYRLFKDYYKILKNS